MRIAVSGSNGLVGGALCQMLQSHAHTVTRITRRPGGGSDQVLWDLNTGRVESHKLEGHDAVVHLAGENILGRWTKTKRQLIYESRTKGTRLLCDAMGSLNHPPEAFICASAVGIYGNRSDQVLHEDSAQGYGFLAEVCRAWESEAARLRKHAVRVVHARIGVVLSEEEGALKKMLMPFRLGLGGRIGSGQQYMSWISIDDLVRGILFAVESKSIQGPVNFTAPHPVTNFEFTETLAKVLRRPALFPIPAFALQLLFGQMAQETLLNGCRVRPARLQEAGFHFRHEHLEDALRDLLHK